MRLLPPAASRRVPWKNGLGSTLEVATDAAAPGGDWTWRLSIADVPSRAAFSAFPGIDRFIACLTGPGLTLERAGARAPVPREGDALAFPGEEAVTGEPLGPGVRDANLMLRRDRWRGRMTLARGRDLTLDAPLVLVHAPEDSPALRADAAEGACEIPPGGTLVASGRVTVAGAPGSAAVACELTAQPSRASAPGSTAAMVECGGSQADCGLEIPTS
ncbi:MAG: HutD family protein [Elusimicrobia bacterium]|nr:HutD family protein [Elusimicrobiota bacterium]